jgi:Protein of unknown function (DUF3071)
MEPAVDSAATGGECRAPGPRVVARRCPEWLLAWGNDEPRRAGGEEVRQLRLVGLAEDGDSLLLESPTGESYRLPLDERVRAACRGDLTRLGQIEIESDNPLRPREIQARVRAGESAEQVAASAGMALERVLRFAYPVLQERSRVVAQARTAPVRPPAPEQLGDLVEERLVGRGTDAATLEWDAWRRDDGRWAVRLSWRHGDSAHAAHWSLDLGRRALQSEDPAAEQLSAKEFHARTITAVTPLAMAARAAAEPAPPPAARGTQRPAQSSTSRATPDRTTPDRTAPDRGTGERPRSDRGGGQRGGAQRGGAQRGGAEGRRPGEDRDAEEDADPPAESRIAAGGGTIPLVDVESEEDRARRATVPSWDDILLGVRRRH